jgi:hypothetical protein
MSSFGELHWWLEQVGRHWFTRELEVPGQISWRRWCDAVPVDAEPA